MTGEDNLWQTVEKRDSGAAGSFVYAVNTTRIYCRPGCPSRLPLRRNVRFYDTVQTAEANGFRPCKRCRPTESATPSERHEGVEKARELLSQSLVRANLDTLARTAGMSKFHFHRLFRTSFGMTPVQYANQIRLQRVRGELRAATSVTFDAGFQSSARFYESIPPSLGMTPGTYRKFGKGLNIQFAFTECWLGKLLVAATPRGVCFISIGDSQSELLAQLRHEFSAADLQPGGEPMAALVANIAGIVEAPDKPTAITVDPQGSDFQRRVWQALTKIRAGKTTSYAALAQAIGQPTAARAVARACATNPIAIVVPCHRVVRGNGDLSGYRWGPQRKKLLLEREAAESAK